VAAPAQAGHAPTAAPWCPPGAGCRGPAGVARRVLYIEDNRVNQIVVESMLAQLPLVTVALASEPADGLRQAFEQPPDLVLLDIQLPGLSGFEVLQQLRQHPATRAVPVVAVSANAMPEDLARAREAGFDDYVTKPLDLDVLLRARAATGLRRCRRLQTLRCSGIGRRAHLADRGDAGPDLLDAVLAQRAQAFGQRGVLDLLGPRRRSAPGGG
jgi:CheY-like chemotaxis protein